MFDAWGLLFPLQDFISYFYVSCRAPIFVYATIVLINHTTVIDLQFGKYLKKSILGLIKKFFSFFFSIMIMYIVLTNIWRNENKIRKKRP